MKKLAIFFGFLLTLIPQGYAATTVFPFPGLVDVEPYLGDAVIDLKYASEQNFLKQNVYGDLKKCYVAPDAANMLKIARSWLKRRDEDLTFVVFDCVRPVSVQRKMWDLVKDTPQKSYVANPDSSNGSMHNYGCAIDLSLYDKKKNAPVDMGTEFDFFGDEAEPRKELALWKFGKLTATQVANRLLLREVMLRAEFRVLDNEWWHFNCMDEAKVRDRLKKIE